MMKEFYYKNPLTREQNEFMDKFNKLNKEMLDYYHFSKDEIMIVEFLWEEPEFRVPVLNIGKLGFKYTLIGTNWLPTKVCNAETMRAAVQFITNQFPLYVPFFILSMGLVTNLSSMARYSFSLPYGYNIISIIESMNKNLKFIREVIKSINEMDAINSYNICKDADLFGI